MQVLLIGSGGREHALAWKLCQSRRLQRLFASAGSHAIQQEGAELVELSGRDAHVDFVRQQKIDLVVVGPEQPLVEGWADALRAQGVAVFGPNAGAAQLEGSKSFAKAFMRRHGIPTARGESFTDLKQARDFMRRQPSPYVLKADGLAGGKGVSIHHHLEDAEEMLAEIFGGRFGEAGRRVVIEEFLPGEEVSCFVFTDGKDFRLAPALQDHKRLLDEDQGGNTGGMGAYSPVPLMTSQLQQQVLQRVVRPTLLGLRREGLDYQGVLYLGLMVQGGKVSVVEYNCRLGDPECQPLMLLLESDVLDLLQASASGGLGQVQVKWRQGCCCLRGDGQWGLSRVSTVGICPLKA